MFGLTELTVLSDETVRLAIIPTVVLPFAVIGMILTSLATWVAAFFGVELKAEGPKRFVELILKPKVIVVSLLLNVVVYSGIVGYKKIQNSSWPNKIIELRNAAVGGSNRSYRNLLKSNHSANENSSNKGTQINSIDVQWHTKIEGAVFGGVVVNEQSLFVGTRKGFLYELDKTDGKILRKFTFGQPIMTKPVVYNNHIYFGEGVHETFNAKFIALDLISGKIAGTVSTSGHIERGPILAEYKDKSYMLVPAGKDGIYAIDPKTMGILWHQKIGHIDANPLVVDGQVYVGTGMEEGDRQTWTKIFLLDLESGKVIAEKEAATSVFGEPFIWKNNVCFNIGDVYQSTNYGQIACYQRADLAEVSAVNLGGAIISNAYVSVDQAVVTDFQGKIHMIDLEKSRLIKSTTMPIHKYNFSSVAQSGDHIILTGKDGLYIYSATDLAEKYVWKVPLENWTGAFETITADGSTWYWSDKEGNVFSLKPLYK